MTYQFLYLFNYFVWKSEFEQIRSNIHIWTNVIFIWFSHIQQKKVLVQKTKIKVKVLG